MATEMPKKQLSAVPPSGGVERGATTGSKVECTASHQSKNTCHGAWVVPARQADGRWQPSDDWRAKAKKVVVKRSEDSAGSVFWRCSATVDFEVDAPPQHDVLVLFVVPYKPGTMFMQVSDEMQRAAIADAFEPGLATPGMFSGSALWRP